MHREMWRLGGAHTGVPARGPSPGVQSWVSSVGRAHRAAHVNLTAMRNIAAGYLQAWVRVAPRQLTSSINLVKSYTLWCRINQVLLLWLCFRISSRV